MLALLSLWSAAALQQPSRRCSAPRVVVGAQAGGGIAASFNRSFCVSSVGAARVKAQLECIGAFGTNSSRAAPHTMCSFQSRNERIPLRSR